MLKSIASIRGVQLSDPTSILLLLVSFLPPPALAHLFIPESVSERELEIPCLRCVEEIHLLVLIVHVHPKRERFEDIIQIGRNGGTFAPELFPEADVCEEDSFLLIEEALVSGAVGDVELCGHAAFFADNESMIHTRPEVWLHVFYCSSQIGNFLCIDGGPG